MSTPVGTEIGTQTVQAGGQIQVRTPQNFSSEHPNLANPNLYYDTDLKWTIASDNPQYDGTTLAEGGSYNYGENVNVQANWRKRVKVVINCPGNDGQAISDLTSHIQINGGVGGEDQTTAFFKENETAVLRVTGANALNQITITANPNRYYTLIGWTEDEPVESQISADTSAWLSNSTELRINAPIQFDSNYLNDKHAVFLNGTTIRITVTTNVPWLNNPVNGALYNYTINGVTHQPSPFGTTQSVSREDFGAFFYCSPCLTTYGIYTFDGWRLDTTPQGSYLTTNPQTPYIYATRPNIVLTAVFLTGNVYTITYHSGLPE